MSVLPANIQDRDGARDLFARGAAAFSIRQADLRRCRISGAEMAKAVAGAGCWKIEIVKRSDLHRFVVLPKRWVVERSFAWISRNRRLMRDFERYAATVAAISQ